MRTIFFLLFLSAVFFLGYWVGKPPRSPSIINAPFKEKKSFVFIVYGCNGSSWCERTLRSIFEQDYEAYRLIWIDDASTDSSLELVKSYILENNQDSRAIVIENEDRLGRDASFKRCMKTVEDREIVVLLDGIDWMASSEVLNRLNGLFQDPKIAVAIGGGLSYPFYREQKEGLISCCGSFAKKMDAFSNQSLINASQKQTRFIPEIFQFVNQSGQVREREK